MVITALHLYGYIACPSEGQRFYDGVHNCLPCEATCANPNPVCTKECRSGCGCTKSTILDEEANACVKPRDCPGACILGDDTVLQDGEIDNRNPCRVWYVYHYTTCTVFV